MRKVILQLKGSALKDSYFNRHFPCSAISLREIITQGGIMFTEKIELKDLDKTDREYRDLLGRVLAIQADCEIGGPHLYVEKMLPAAPTKLDQLIVARTAAEEIDHFRKVARVAGDMGVDVSFVLSQPNEKRFVDAFRGLITTWEDNAALVF
jgi:1,2-phenylacetyl-CoA epoxidase catalytic subunit